jgi:Ca2+-binding RTX toxin-like protein
MTTGLTINAVYDPGVNSAPAGFKTAVEAAIQNLENTFTNPIAITIAFGWDEVHNSPVVSTGQSLSFDLRQNYSQVRSALAASVTSSDDLSAVATLPAQDPTNGGVFFVPWSQALALGLSGVPTGQVDGYVGLSASAPFNFDPNNRAVPGQLDATAVLEHEISEVMGRSGSLGTYAGPNVYKILDLFRYTLPENRDLTPGPGYCSVDGTHLLAQYNDPTGGGDAADWSSAVRDDAFDQKAPSGQLNAVSPVDVQEMDVIGWDTTGTSSASPTLSILDTSTNTPLTPGFVPYSGLVSGLAEQYINITSENLNVTAGSPGWFIHTGSGTDAIAVLSGINVLDGGTGSNFLVGGTGSDTFFVDDRGAGADIWSTVAGFHTGDAATIWGVTPQDFHLAWADNQGAAGFTGLTSHATAAGNPTASLTLAGFSQADLNNGRLSVQFGTVGDSSYMYMRGNS